MKYFLDSEFFEDGYKRIDLIAIALVCDDGREYYAVAKDGWNPFGVSEWLMENVLPFLSPSGERAEFLDTNQYLSQTQIPWRSREQIKQDLTEFILPNDKTKPEFWGYFSDYDWVLFCQLFGRMLDLPQHFPKYCNDVKQFQELLLVKKSEMPKQASGNHNALHDARHIKVMHDYLYSILRNPPQVNWGLK